nr:putative reverse transcriptase domain-containing protein [Tanacetum cinerariifolium]
MRQRRWIELFSDYDCEIRYHPGKANVVVDLLSRKKRVKPKRMTMIMDEAHATRYSINPRVDKMYYDLRDMYWWPYIPEWKWDKITMDFITKLPRSSGGLYTDEIVARHGVPVSIISDQDGRFTSRKYRSPVLWVEVGENRLIGPTMVQKNTDKVVILKERLKAARDRQKSYVDNRRKPLEFEVGDQVLLKLTPWKGVIRFGKKGKLAPKYVGPFEILKRIVPKCLADANLHVLLEEIKVDKTLRFVEEPIEIMDLEVKKLKRSRIPIVKVRWNSKRGPEFTWEREDSIKAKYPNLFDDRVVKTTMADNRTMAEMLRAPTEGCAEAIVVPSVLAEQFKLKHSLINMMTSEQFFGLEKNNPHDHIRCFTELHQLDTFYNALNPTDQDSLNAAVGGNLLEKSPQDALTIIKNKSKVRNSRSKSIASPVNACDINSSFEIAKLTHAFNQQTSVVTTAMTAMLKQLQANLPPAQVKAVKEICVTCGGAHPYYQCLAAGGNTFPEFRDNIQGYVSAAASNYNQGSGSLPGNTVANPKGELKAITTRSGLVTDGPTVPTPPKSVTPEEDECVKETYTDPDLAEYTIKVPPPPKMLKALLSNKEKLQELVNTPLNENCSVVILKKLLKKLEDPGKFLIPCGFTDFVVVDYESDPRVPLILGRPFLRTTRALIDVHGEEMILCDGDERLTLNMKHDTTIYSNHPHRESVNLINIFNVSSEDCLEVSVSNQTSGNPTFSLHKEITSPQFTHEIHDSEGCNFLSEFDIKSDLREIEFLLYQGKDFDLKDSIDQTDLANLDDYFVDPTPEMFNDEHAPDYSFPSRFDVYDDDFLKDEFDANNVYDDPFDSKGEKIKESKLLIDELDLPCDFLPYLEYDSFAYQDFSRDDDLPSLDNKDKVFNLGIIIQEESVTIITRVAQEKKLATSYASLVFEDFDPPFYEPLVFKDVLNSMMLLPFSSENEEKVFKPGIYTSEKVHSCFLLELSHLGYHVFKVNLIFISPMKIFHVQSGKKYSSLGCSSVPFLSPLIHSSMREFGPAHRPKTSA